MPDQSRVLILDSAPAAAREAVLANGGTTFGDNYIDALRSCMPALDTWVLNAGDCEKLPQGVALSDFDGIVWTGSPLDAFAQDPVVRFQADLAKAGFESGVPGFGSCWGVQIMSVALGGRVHRHPTGFEFGVARYVRVNAAGRSHPMYAGKPDTFDALCLHRDEVAAPPPGATVLASNDHSAVQALCVEDGARSFWGVQYHPEFDLAMMAALYRRAAPNLPAIGLARASEDGRAIADDLRALHDDPDRTDVAWRYGLRPDVTDMARHRIELGNWLRGKVIPHAAGRG